MATTVTCDQCGKELKGKVPVAGTRPGTSEADVYALGIVLVHMASLARTQRRKNSGKGEKETALDK